MYTIHDNLKRYFPFVYEDAVSHHQVSMYELVVELIDGSSVIYDDFEKTIRVLPPDSDDMTEEECRREFGCRLRRMMFIKHMNQSELSKKTRIPQALLSRYMNGKTTPSFYNVDRICKVLGCSIEDLRYIK